MKKRKVAVPTLYNREVYKGENWANSTQRPGCLDFLKCPSRTGDKLREHRPPIINSSKLK